jgi:uncharacterized protein YjiS (DUF1127 family)
MSTISNQSMTNHHGYRLLSVIAETLQTWRERRHGRRELARWSERDLRDVGLSPGDVIFEAGKPFWRA